MPYSPKDIERLTDELAAFLILQLAEQGRPVEVQAQMLASWFAIDGGMAPSHIADDVTAIITRTVELLGDESQIWEGLLPGPPTTPRWSIVEQTKLTAVPDREPIKNEHEYHISIWRNNVCRAGGYIEYSESPLNFAHQYRYRMDKMIPSGDNIDGWAVLILHVNTETYYLMTYEIANLIVKLDEARDALKSWSGVTEPDDVFQAIAEDMQVKGLAFAQTNDMFNRA